MNEQDINITIATECGFHVPKWIGDEYDSECGICGCKPASHKMWPDYINDLNAMHEAEKILIEQDRWERYEDELCNVVSHQNEFPQEIIHATACQRAEAFLRTIDKWK